MSWLDNIVRCYKYRCPEGHMNLHNLKPAEFMDLKANPSCACGLDTEYAGFSNVPSTQGGMSKPGVLKVSYDQNGRKAYKIGNTYMSQTKYDYLETGDTQSKYTAAYQEKLRDDAAREVRRSAAMLSKHL